MHTDNFETTVQAITTRIRQSALAPMARRLDDDLEGLLRGSGYVEFQTQTGEDSYGPRYSSVTLYVRCDCMQADNWSSRHVTEEDGSRWARPEVYCEVNWSALGAHEARWAVRYASLINAVAELALCIEAEWKGQEIWQCTQTAEETREYARKQAERKAQLVAENIVANGTKGWRVGRKDAVDSQGLPEEGNWEVTTKRGTFTVTTMAMTDGKCFVCRTA